MNYALIKKTKKFVIVLVCLLLGAAQWSIAQNIQVKGTVTDGTGEPVIGARVIQKGTTTGMTTNPDGSFSLSVPGNATLEVYSLGYIRQDVSVNNRTTINVILKEDVQVLDEVVVTGYGTQKKATLSGSIATVSSKELTVTKNENIVNMLSGKVPGLRITQRSAQPGAYNTVVDVRGFGEPLFVVDGVARDKGYFSRMDPEEIESISLLKDASAAIYGIRAASGVMLITTRRGVAQGGKIDINYTGNFSLQQMIFIPDGLNPIERATLRNEQAWRDFNNNFFVRQPAFYNDDRMEEWRTIKTYDWNKELFREFTPQVQHNVNLNGGTETLRYFFSLGYIKQDGAYASGSLWSEKYNVRSNVDAKITNRLSLNISLGAAIDKVHEPNATLWDNYKAAFLTLPSVPVYANDNPEYLNGFNPENNEFTNLKGKMDEKYVGYNERNRRNLNGSARLTYEVPGVKGLSAYAFMDYSFSVPDETSYKKVYNTWKYIPETDTYEVGRVENGDDDKLSTISRNSSFSYGTTQQLGLSYNARFGDHSVDATGVYEQTYSAGDGGLNAARQLLYESPYLSMGESATQRGGGGTPSDRAQRAYVGKINYDYLGKYIVSLIGRYEANSRWPKDSRWALFPAVTAGWMISEESFIKDNIDFLSKLKLRASYGIMGDEGGASNYPDIFTGLEFGGNFGWIYSADGATKGTQATNIPNPNKTWVKAISKNVGLDIGFLRGKITAEIDVFQRDREGLLANNIGIVVPGTVGASLPQTNINEDRRFGWELVLAYRDRINDFNYFFSSQISFTRRQWLYRMEDPATHSFDHWRNRYSGRYHNDDFWWSNESKGMFKSIAEIRSFSAYPVGQATLPGDWYSVDWNNDGIVDGSDSHPMATKGLPYFNYGIMLGGDFKGFDFQANFAGSYKVYKDLSEVFVEALPFGGNQNGLNWFMDRWHPVNPTDDYWHPDTQWISGYYPLTGGSGRRDDSNGIMNSSYLRMKTIELGYTLPKTLLAKAGIKNIRVFLNGYNLLTFSPLKSVDPERPSVTSGAGGSGGGADGMYVYPNDKTYTIGASFKF